MDTSSRSLEANRLKVISPGEHVASGQRNISSFYGTSLQGSGQAANGWVAAQGRVSSHVGITEGA